MQAAFPHERVLAESLACVPIAPSELDHLRSWPRAYALGSILAPLRG